MVQVYGAVFNPLRPSSGRGCEFLTYGMKHLKTWVLDDTDNWITTPASFGVDRVQNVHCAVFIPAQHQGKAPGDSCIVTGFPDGTIGTVPCSREDCVAGQFAGCSQCTYCTSTWFSREVVVAVSVQVSGYPPSQPGQGRGMHSSVYTRRMHLGLT